MPFIQTYGSEQDLNRIFHCLFHNRYIALYKMVNQRSLRVSSEAKFVPYAFGNALGLVSIVTLVVYAVLVWFGGYDAAAIVAKYPISFEFDDWTFIFGIVQTYVIGYIMGWIFAKIYNRFS